MKTFKNYIQENVSQEKNYSDFVSVWNDFWKHVNGMSNPNSKLQVVEKIKYKIIELERQLEKEIKYHSDNINSYNYINDDQVQKKEIILKIFKIYAVNGTKPEDSIYEKTNADLEKLFNEIGGVKALDKASKQYKKFPSYALRWRELKDFVDKKVSSVYDKFRRNHLT